MQLYLKEKGLHQHAVVETFQKSEFDKNYLIKNVPADGACLYHAISLAAGLPYKGAQRLRDETAAYFEREPELWIGPMAAAARIVSARRRREFLTWYGDRSKPKPEISDYPSMKKYYHGIKKTVWGGDTEIEIIGRKYNLQIYVFDVDRRGVIRKIGPKGDPSGRTVRIWRKGSHYQAVMHRSVSNREERDLAIAIAASLEESPGGESKHSRNLRILVLCYAPSALGYAQLFEEYYRRRVPDSADIVLVGTDTGEKDRAKIGNKEYHNTTITEYVKTRLTDMFDVIIDENCREQNTEQHEADILNLVVHYLNTDGVLFASADDISGTVSKALEKLGTFEILPGMDIMVFRKLPSGGASKSYSSNLKF